MNTPCILYIDDEENNLTSFLSNFRKYYTIYTTSSVDEAFAILKEKDIHIVLSDQIMKDMSGIEFLTHVSARHPAVMRIVITAYSNLDLAIDAINKVNAYGYLTKPFNVTIWRH